MSSNHIRRLFCDTFFFNSALFSFLFFFLYFFFRLFFLFCTCSALIFFIFYSFQIYFKFSISRRWLFLSQNYLRQLWQIVEVRRLLRCPGYLLARLSRAFAKCRIKRKNVILGLPKVSNQRVSAFISNHRIHCTTLGCILSM